MLHNLKNAISGLMHCLECTYVFKMDVEMGWEMGDWIQLRVGMDQVLGSCEHGHVSVHM